MYLRLASEVHPSRSIFSLSGSAIPTLFDVSLYSEQKCSGLYGAPIAHSFFASICFFLSANISALECGLVLPQDIIVVEACNKDNIRRLWIWHLYLEDLKCHFAHIRMLVPFQKTVLSPQFRIIV